MEPERLRRVMLPGGSSIGAAIRAMDAARCGIVLVVDERERLIGVVTDGDARRAVLQGLELGSPVDDIMSRDPIVLHEGEGREEALALLQSDRCAGRKSILLPCVSRDGRPLNIFHSTHILEDEWETLPQSERPMHVLLIGGGGYIGSMATRVLLAANYRVTVLDKFLYGEEALAGIREHPRLEILRGDTRHIDFIVASVRKVEAVVHLAELVGDPLCASDAQTTFEINYLATAAISRACAHLQVNRFIYVSSCSVYGSSPNPDKILDEDSQLAPVSLYAKMKINSEDVIQRTVNGGNFSPCIFRLGTVFGLSYRPRFDLVVNTLTAKAVSERRIEIFGGNQWRPHVHVNDVAHALDLALRAPLEKIRGQVFNISTANHKIDEIGQMVKDLIPGTDLTYSGAAVDQRNYRVSSHKAREILSFNPSIEVSAGISEIAEAFRAGQIDDYRAEKYHNVQAYGRRE